jgi:lysophospholipase L1-like esterase
MARSASKTLKPQTMGKIFLYGGDVGRIQSFIKTTNKLKEIVGGSELVEYVTKDLPFEILNWRDPASNPEVIQTAAGHIRIAFTDEASCKLLVESLPMAIAEKAPGLLFAQAVYAVEGEVNKAAWEALDDLLRQQKNNPAAPAFSGLMSMQLSRRTGEPVIWREGLKKDEDFIDAGAIAKLEAFDNRSRLLKKSVPEVEGFAGREMPANLEEWVQKDEWLAVIHADGNALGQTLIRLWEEKWNQDSLPKIKRFSADLEEATKAAFQKTVIDVFDYEVAKLDVGAVLPYRSIVIGGDDVTLICKSQHALPFVQAYLKNFEEATQGIDAIKETGLTACAGIAIVKKNYPFSQAEALAESLCKAAKDASKKLRERLGGKVPASLYFHKVQGSYVESFDELDRLYYQTENNLSFNAGPYFLEAIPADAGAKNHLTIEDLKEGAKLLAKKKESVKKGIASKVRQWLTLSKSVNTLTEANKIVKEMKLEGADMSQLGIYYLSTQDNDTKISPLLDIHTLSSINKNQS